MKWDHKLAVICFSNLIGIVDEIVTLVDRRIDGGEGHDGAIVVLLVVRDHDPLF